MISLECWPQEISTIVCGYIGVNIQASQVILTNISSLLYMVGLGIQQTVGTLLNYSIDLGLSSEAY